MSAASRVIPPTRPLNHPLRHIHPSPSPLGHFSPVIWDILVSSGNGADDRNAGGTAMSEVQIDGNTQIALAALRGYRHLVDQGILAGRP